MRTIETYKGFEIEVEKDDYAESPRDWDNFGTMLCLHSKYDLGDEHDLDSEEIIEISKRKDLERFWLYLLDHSGVWMRTQRFAEDPQGWDTSKVGIIYVTHDDIKKEYGKLTKTTKEKARQLLLSEVSTFSDYISGERYGYTVKDKEGEHIDSCWGFYGSDFEKNGLLEDARDAIDWEIKERAKERAEAIMIEVGRENAIT